MDGAARVELPIGSQVVLGRNGPLKDALDEVSAVVVEVHSQAVFADTSANYFRREPNYFGGKNRRDAVRDEVFDHESNFSIDASKTQVQKSFYDPAPNFSGPAQIFRSTLFFTQLLRVTNSLGACHSA
jgi:hypothetical protein